ncbi:MAG: HAMP domain-containing histidine kinase, partial [Pyrinomonadaceae bacterium]|nr:HAMP domain-containing histidine kinase [Pyrinomonadaceae bacterium]
MNFLNTFRARLLIILALLLVATLSVQYYVNLRTQDENINLTEVREQALRDGLSIGVNTITSDMRIQDFVKREGQSFYDERSSSQIKDILVINEDWEINDSLSDKYLPSVGEDGEAVNIDLKTVTDLPPLKEGPDKLGADHAKFPNANMVSTKDADSEAHAIPVETSVGRWYVIVILGNDRNEAARRAGQTLIYTLGILLFSTLITIFLVWRFTRPIANLSKAARRVADGNLNFRLKDADRNDELGELAAQFNEMTAELEKTKELQAQLQEAEKSAVVGRLASAIAHEIRNPLNYINLTLDHLRKKFKPEDTGQQETFEKLTRQLKVEVDRINQQVSDFLRYSRPIDLEIEPVDLRRVINDSLRIVEPQAKEQNIKISVIERENVSKVLGDPEVLRSVFNNLFINGTQAMEKHGGNLNVILSGEQEWVRVDVKDTGGGIPRENLSKIFQPYFSTKETGTGLGLAIVKKIVDDHGGKIGVESDLGKGTTFTVELP